MASKAIRSNQAITAWDDCLRAAVAGRLWILIGNLGAQARTAENLSALGACDILLVGYGAVPAGYGGPVLEVSRPEGGAREVDYLLSAPAVPVEDLLERFDPTGEAVVLGGGFFDRDTFWGRRYLGGRAAKWQALEDKTGIDRLWDDLGIRRAPSAIVPPRLDALLAAARDIDAGKGTVWSGERGGRRPADGAEFVFWVQGEAQGRHAARALAAADRGVRVMPYLEGVSCSIHAIVGHQAASVFRPVEVITLPRLDGGFLYAGTSTWWDPPCARRDEMRALARSVASHLSSTLNYRGAFTVDGILTTQGFLPTELNPRWGAGLWPQAMVCPLPLRLIESLVTSGLDGPMALLEQLVVERADTTRFGGPTLRGVLSGGEGSLLLRRQGSGFAATKSANEGVARVTVARTADKATVTVRPTGDVFRGQSLRPLAKAGFELGDRMLGTGVGPLR